jgi:chaperonin GroEL
MYNRMKFGSASREKLFRGIEKVFNAVSITMGPNGRNVVMDNSFGPPIVTKDGVSVAKGIVLRDKVEDLGARMIIDAAHRTGLDCGDGTTTATVLAYGMIQDGLELLSTEEFNPIDLKRGMDKALEVAVESLKNQAIDISGDLGKLKQVATISANNDEVLGEIIGSAIHSVGVYGMVNVEQSVSEFSSWERKSGFNFNTGWLSSQFITNQKKAIVEYEDPYILIYNDRLVNVNELITVIEKAVNDLKPLLLIVNDIDNSALNYFISSRVRSGFNICIVRAPGYALEKEMTLADLATVTGGMVITDDNKNILGYSDGACLGRADKVIIGRESTSIIMNQEVKEMVNDYVEGLKGMISYANEGFDRDLIEKRISNLTAASVVIKIGAKTDIELKEKMDRVDDAVNATMVALKHGIVPGGGVSYIKAMAEVEKMESENPGEKAGYEIVQLCLPFPLEQIAENSGIDEPNSISVAVEEDQDPHFGYNAKTGKFENLVESGIIDPVSVVVSALQNAVSVAGMVLLTDCVISKSKD